MATLVNAYCTLRDPPVPDFPHELVGRRDRSDPELKSHLAGFQGYAWERGGKQMTAPLYHLICHIGRVQQQFSMSVEDDALDALARWGHAANAIFFLPDGTVRDPNGLRLIAPPGVKAEGSLPYPRDAHERKARSEAILRDKGVQVLQSLPPVVGEGEADLRDADDVWRRSLALVLVAVRAESLASGNEIPPADLAQKSPIGAESLTPRERAFFETAAPDQNAILQFSWRYEALALLQWALNLTGALPFPSNICDVPQTAKIALEANVASFAERAVLRPAGELLDALDLHFRLHWAVRQARQANQPPPTGVEPGVVAQRHYALNWLVRFEDRDWDDVDTPT